MVVIAVGLVLAIMDGGFPLTVWYSTALFLLSLLAAVVVAAPPARRDRSRLVEVALMAFAALCVWALLSIGWADQPGPAWDGANRVLLYLIVLGVICLRPWSRRDGTLAVGLLGFGTAAIAIWLLLTGASSDNAASYFLEGRLAGPIGYLNASASLWLIGFFPAVHMALARGLPWPVRGLGLACATLLLQTALLTQSRGAAIAFVVTVVAYVAFTTRRVAAVLALATVILLTVLAAPPLLDVRRARFAADLGPALDTAVQAIAITVAIAFVLGVGAWLVGRRIEPLIDQRRGMRRLGDLAVGALGVCGVVAALMAIGNPVSWVDARWDDFKSSGYEALATSSTRFGGSLGSGRYDFYRVALDEFESHPIRGIGADNYAAEYLQRRRTPEAPQYPHSNVLMVLSQLGAIGAALLATFLALMAWAAVRARRAVSRDHGAVVAAALATAMVWLVQGLGDWLWEFPALGILGLSLLGVAARSRPDVGCLDPKAVDRLQVATPTRSGIVASLGIRVAVALIALAAATSLAVPGVAARYVSAAYDDAVIEPASALSKLERAAEINPFNADALIAKGVIAQRQGRSSVATDALQRAIGRAPNNWFAHLELGLVQAADGKSSAAERSIRTALRLNPDQPLTRKVLATVLRGEAVSSASVERRLSAVLERRFKATDSNEAAAGD